MIKYFPLLSILALPSVAADNSYPFCTAPLLPNITHFSVHEVYDGRADVIQVQVGPDVRIGLTCGLSDEGDFVGFNDWGAGMYNAEPDPIRASASTIAKYPVFHMCTDQDTNKIVYTKQGYFNAVPQLYPGTGERMTDYTIYDGRVSGYVNSDENLKDVVTIRDMNTIRDKNQRIVAVARKSDMEWEIENPGQLSPAYIGFVLTHKVNKKTACWGSVSGNGNDNGGPGFWPSIGIAVGATAAITGVIAATIYASCRICEKCDQRRRYEQVSQEQEMMSAV